MLAKKKAVSLSMKFCEDAARLGLAPEALKSAEEFVLANAAGATVYQELPKFVMKSLRWRGFNLLFIEQRRRRQITLVALIEGTPPSPPSSPKTDGFVRTLLKRLLIGEIVREISKWISDHQGIKQQSELPMADIEETSFGNGDGGIGLPHKNELLLRVGSDPIERNFLHRGVDKTRYTDLSKFPWDEIAAYGDRPLEKKFQYLLIRSLTDLNEVDSPPACSMYTGAQEKILDEINTNKISYDDQVSVWLQLRSQLIALKNHVSGDIELSLNSIEINDAVLHSLELIRKQSKRSKNRELLTISRIADCQVVQTRAYDERLTRFYSSDSSIFVTSSRYLKLSDAWLGAKRNISYGDKKSLVSLDVETQ